MSKNTVEVLSSQELGELIDQAAISIRRAAEIARVSPSTMQRWLRRGGVSSQASEVFCMALVAHKYIAAGPWMNRWVRPEFATRFIAY